MTHISVLCSVYDEVSHSRLNYGSKVVFLVLATSFSFIL